MNTHVELFKIIAVYIRFPFQYMSTLQSFILFQIKNQDKNYC